MSRLRSAMLHAIKLFIMIIFRDWDDTLPGWAFNWKMISEMIFAFIFLEYVCKNILSVYLANVFSRHIFHLWSFTLIDVFVGKMIFLFVSWQGYFSYLFFSVKTTCKSLDKIKMSKKIVNVMKINILGSTLR